MPQHLAVDEADQVLLHLLGERRLRWGWGVYRGQVDQSTGICMCGSGGLERSAPLQQGPNKSKPPSNTHPHSTHARTSKPEKGYIQKARTQTHLAAHLGLQRGDLLQDDAVFLLLRARLPDGLECGSK